MCDTMPFYAPSTKHMCQLMRMLESARMQKEYLGKSKIHQKRLEGLKQIFFLFSFTRLSIIFDIRVWILMGRRYASGSVAVCHWREPLSYVASRVSQWSNHKNNFIHNFWLPKNSITRHWGASCCNNWTVLLPFLFEHSCPPYILVAVLEVRTISIYAAFPLSC